MSQTNLITLDNDHHSKSQKKVVRYSLEHTIPGQSNAVIRSVLWMLSIAWPISQMILTNPAY